MEGLLDFLFSNETLAIVIPLVVFLITLIMVVKRLINFVITLVLLAFAIVSGLAIINYQVVSDYMNNDIPQERFDELNDGLYRFKEQLMEAVDDLRQDLRDEDTQDEKMSDPIEGETSYLLRKVERQEAKLSQLMERLEVRQQRGSVN